MLLNCLWAQWIGNGISGVDKSGKGLEFDVFVSDIVREVINAYIN